MDHSMPGLPVHHGLLEFTQTHIHRVSDAIQPSHPLSSPSPPAFNLSQHQGIFKWVSPSHQVAKVLEFQASALVLPVNIQGWFPIGLTGSPCSPRDSQESSPAPQFESISSSVLNPLYGPTLISIHDYRKTIALIIWNFVGKVMSLLFNMLCKVKDLVVVME